jgi:hypothetical protein
LSALSNNILSLTRYSRTPPFPRFWRITFIIDCIEQGY